MMKPFAVRAPANWSISSFAGCNRVDRRLRTVREAVTLSLGVRATLALAIPLAVILALAAAVILASTGGSLAQPSPEAKGIERRISLKEALVLAEENAFEVKAAYHDSLAAEHGLRAAKSAWYPTLGVLGGAFALHPQDPIGAGPLQIEPDWNSIYAANLRLTYPIYTGGRRSNDIRRQRENLRAQSADLTAARLANAHETRQAYIGLLIADRMLGATEASYRRVTVIRAHVQNLFAAGVADSIDVLETEISLRAARRMVEEMHTRKRNASARLASILAVPVEETIVATETVPEPAPPAAELSAAPDVSHRPELLALDRRISAAEYQRAIVKSGLRPTVSGMGGYAVVRPDLGIGESQWQDIWWLGLNFSWDLNLGGKELAQSGQALEAVRSLEMTRLDVRDSLALQAQIAWNNIEEAYAIYGLSREELGIAERRFALAEDKQKAGGMTVNALLELEEELARTEQHFEAARLKYFAAVTDYLYAVGSDALWEGL